jgi:crotonobetainyl-CoA:carnitine CoA-transferase CaiB-like acyl-CoA transferase
MAGPLHGVRVLDLSRVLAGPWAGQLLADLGADVIKVEKPGAGDDTRAWGPPYLPDAKGEPTSEAAYYLSANRGKRSVAIDMTQAEGQALIQQLATTVDVVLENFKRGGLAKYGLDYASLSALNPKLVYCSITGFGQTGPNADRPGYDFIVQGMAGLMSITGSPESGPLKVGVAIADLTTGMYSVIGVLSALLHARATGQGQHLDLALFDVQLGWLANQNMNYLAGGKTPGLLGNAHPNIVPYQDFETADGRVIVAVGNDAQYRRYCALLGHPEWGVDPDFVSNAQRVKNRVDLIARVSAVMRTRSTQAWLEALEAAGIPAGPIYSIPQAFATDQVAARGLKVTQPHPTAGTVTTVANPIKFSATPIIYDRPPPLLGEHSKDILRGLGLNDDAISALAAKGVVELA